MKKLISLLLAVCMLFTLVACGNGDDSKEPANTDNQQVENNDNETAGTFVFGGVGPLTGDTAIYGNAVKNGAEIAVEEINAQGGIQIELNFQDDVGDPETSVNAYHKLLDDGMQVLVGPVLTGAAISVSAELYNDRVFGLTPSASSADVTAGKDNMFQLCFTDPNQGVAAAEYMAASAADSTIAIIYRNDDAYSQGIRDAFVAKLAESNITPAYEGTFTADTATDFSVQLAAAQSAGADMIFLPIYYQPASVIMAQANQMGYAPTFFGVDGMDGILTLEGFDTSLAEGVMVQSPFSADADDETTVHFVTKYVEKTGETPNQFAADGYDCVYALYNAMLASGCTPDMSAEDICELLVAYFTGGFSYDGLTGSGMTWSTNGEVSKSPNIYVITDGKYVAE